MKITELAFTCYPVTDLRRARAFYEGLLGLKPTRVFGDDTKAWIEYDLGPNTLAIGNLVPDWQPGRTGGCVGLEVEDFDAALRELRDGGASVQGPIQTPVCRLAVVADPDGNTLLIHRRGH